MRCDICDSVIARRPNGELINGNISVASNANDLPEALRSVLVQKGLFDLDKRCADDLKRDFDAVRQNADAARSQSIDLGFEALKKTIADRYRGT
jgi:hypothetical protein